jgi:hypothetical protein
MRNARKAYKTHGFAMDIIWNMIRSGKKKKRSGRLSGGGSTSVSTNSAGKPFRLTGY